MTVSKYMAAKLSQDFIMKYGHEDRFEIEETEDSFTVRKQGAKERIPHPHQKVIDNAEFGLLGSVDGEI